MASNKYLVLFGLVFMMSTIIVQSAPIEKIKSVQSSSVDNKQAVNEPLLDSIQTEKTSSTSSSTTMTSPTTTLSQQSSVDNIQEKKKRSTYLESLDAPINDESDDEHAFHANIQETSAQIHDNADKPVDTDDSRVYSDIQMTPLNLKNILRRRREVKLHDQSSQRHKRALSPYDFYETNSFYDPYADLIEQQEYDRPIRSFAPLYWYPTAYERSLRSAVIPSYYESSELPSFYSSADEDEDVYENEDPDDDDNDYESNRYPILVPSSNQAFDNYGLQPEYEIEEIPFNDEYITDLNEDDDRDEQWFV